MKEKLIKLICTCDNASIDEALNNYTGSSNYELLDEYLKDWSINDLLNLIREIAEVELWRVA